MVPTLNIQLGSFPTQSRAENFPLCRQDYPFPPTINRGGFHGMSREKFRSKNHKKPAIPLFPFFFSPISLLRLSLLSLSPLPHQPPTTFPSASSSPAPPRVTKTTSRPPPRLKQSLFFPISHLYKILLPSPVIDSGHRSSQRRRTNHHLNLLITAETPSSSEPHAECELLLFTFCK